MYAYVNTPGKPNGTWHQEVGYGRINANRAMMSAANGRPDRSGFLVQSRFGRRGNFEVVVPSAVNGLLHFWRNNDNPSLPWSGATSFAQGDGHFVAASLIQSNFGNGQNFEIVAVTGNKLVHWWRDSRTNWHGPFEIANGVSGIPSLIQSRFGRRGNFEVVVPSAGNGLLHFWRNNDNPSLPWSGATSFAQGDGHFVAASLIQSNFGNGRNFEIVAVTGNKLVHWWRDGRTNWHGSSEIANGVSWG